MATPRCPRRCRTEVQTTLQNTINSIFPNAVNVAADAELLISSLLKSLQRQDQLKIVQEPVVFFTRNVSASASACHPPCIPTLPLNGGPEDELPVPKLDLMGETAFSVLLSNEASQQNASLTSHECLPTHSDDIMHPAQVAVVDEVVSQAWRAAEALQAAIAKISRHGIQKITLARNDARGQISSRTKTLALSPAPVTPCLVRKAVDGPEAELPHVEDFPAVESEPFAILFAEGEQKAPSKPPKLRRLRQRSCDSSVHLPLPKLACEINPFPVLFSGDELQAGCCRQIEPLVLPACRYEPEAKSHEGEQVEPSTPTGRILLPSQEEPTSPSSPARRYPGVFNVIHATFQLSWG